MPAAAFASRSRVIAAVAATAVALAVLVAASGHFSRDPPAHPAAARYTGSAAGLPLADGFQSYQSVDAVMARLSAAGHATSRHRIARPPSADYPPRALDTLVVQDYDYRGLSALRGRLVLEFFNDRLFEADFRPADPAAAAQLLQAELRSFTRDRNGRAERLQGDLRIATNLDYATSPVGSALSAQAYLIWQDLRLVRERNDWDGRFGAIPYRAEP